MTNTPPAIDGMLLHLTEEYSPRTLAGVLNTLREMNNSSDLSALADSFTLLWEAWSEELDPSQAAFCIDLAKLRTPDSPLFRTMLGNAVKTTLPPYLSKPGVIRALGLRDHDVPLFEIMRRLDRLNQLKNGLVVFLSENARWGIIQNIDALNATVAVGSADGGSMAIPMERILTASALFNAGAETARLSVAGRPNSKMSSTEFRNLVHKNSLLKFNDNALKNFAERVMVPGAIASKDFDAWYTTESVDPTPVAAAQTTATPGVRCSSNSRSLKEMDLYLDKEIAAGKCTVNDMESAAYRTFFTNLKAEVAQRDAKALAEIVAKLFTRVQHEKLSEICEPLRGKAPFWPDEPLKAQLASLEVWGELAVKLLDKLSAATAAIFDPDYRVALAVKLPLRSLNVFCETLPDKLLNEVFSHIGVMSSDLILWIWKNKKRCSVDLFDMVNLENVIKALNQSQLPKAWGPAQRELRTLLIDKKEFHIQMVGSANDDVTRITGALQAAAMFNSGERQSLMVKLSRYSDDMRRHLEEGLGNKIMTAGTAKQEQPSEPAEPTYTSLASHRRLVQELNDIINIHQPENREALKTARAHGDFRENSEFDAAKERRNFLTKRRNELERDIMMVHAMDFRNVTPAEYADLGCAITLRYEDKSEECFYLLGAWDGDPDRNYLSYKTKLGEVLRHRQLNDNVVLPDGRTALLAKIEPLPESVLKDME